MNTVNDTTGATGATEDAREIAYSLGADSYFTAQLSRASRVRRRRVVVVVEFRRREHLALFFFPV